MNNFEISNRINQYRTSHLLHLILSIISAGVWIPVWILITMSNAIERTRLRRKFK